MQKKVVKEIEVTSVYKLKGSEGFGAILGGIMIIPHEGIRNGYKQTYADKVFISAGNYQDIKGLPPDAIMTVIDALKEAKGEME